MITNGKRDRHHIVDYFPSTRCFVVDNNVKLLIMYQLKLYITGYKIKNMKNACTVLAKYTVIGGAKIMFTRISVNEYGQISK